MTYRHYYIPGGYNRPASVISRAGRYKLPENYDKAPVGALSSSLPLDQTDPDTDPPVVEDDLPNPVFSWEPETAETPPGSITFSRAITAPVLTNGTTNWEQTAKIGEIRYEGLRRVENLFATDDVSSLMNVSGGAVDNGSGSFTFPGASNAEIVDATLGAFESGSILGYRFTVQATAGSGTLTVTYTGSNEAVLEFTVDSTPRTYYIARSFSAAATPRPRIRNNATGGPFALTYTLSDIVAVRQQGLSDGPPEVVPVSVTDNANVPGVSYFATTNGNTIDGNGEVTEAAGTTITGGGYLAEPTAVAGDADIFDTDLAIPSIFTVFVDVTMPDPLPTGDVIVAMGTDQGGGVGFVRVADDGTITAFDGANTLTSTVTAVAGARLKAAYWRDSSNQYFSVNGETTVSGPAGSSAFVGGKFRLLATNGGDHWSTEASPTSKGAGHLFQVYDGAFPSSQDLTSFFL